MTGWPDGCSATGATGASPPNLNAKPPSIRSARKPAPKYGSVAIASDLSLYNEEKIIRGIETDRLFEELGEEIEEGRALYKSRVSPGLYQRNFYDRALVDILVKSKGHIRSRIW